MSQNRHLRALLFQCRHARFQPVALCAQHGRHCALPAALPVHPCSLLAHPQALWQQWRAIPMPCKPPPTLLLMAAKTRGHAGPLTSPVMTRKTGSGLTWRPVCRRCSNAAARTAARAARLLGGQQVLLQRLYGGAARLRQALCLVRARRRCLQLACNVRTGHLACLRNPGNHPALVESTADSPPLQTLLHTSQQLEQAWEEDS